MIYAVCFGYVVGIAGGLFIEQNFFASLCALAGMSSALAGLYFQQKRWIEAALCLICLYAGYTHAQAVYSYWQVPRFEHTVAATAVVAQPPVMKERTQEAVIQMIDCGSDHCPQFFVLAYFSVYEDIHYGDTFSLVCPLKEPQNTGLNFDYKMYLATRHIGYTCYPKDIHKQSDAGGNMLLRSVLGVRSALEDNVDRVVVYPESGLVKGLLFGGNGYLTKELQESFSRTGLSHIVAVSGANVVIVIESVFLLAIGCGLWRRQALVLAVVAVVFFVVMVGCGASAVRAGCMGGLVLLASFSGRNNESLRLWALVLAGMLWYNPLFLRYDLGFQLSFMATLGIMLCMPLYEAIAHTNKICIGGMLWEIVWMTISAEVFVLPIIVYNFHTIPTLSLLANMFILPAIPFAMFFGFMASICVFVWMPMASFFGVVAYLLLHYMLFVVGVIGSQSAATITIESMNIWIYFCWYGALLIGVKMLRSRYRE